ncbi:hypothetical protein BU15DRAFT_63873 [Melanogaster broomeanus]|nr:hypothetical protein BU15DRAFT_63873 [Melanogaster broomeanus]
MKSYLVFRWRMAVLPPSGTLQSRDVVFCGAHSRDIMDLDTGVPSNAIMSVEVIVKPKDNVPISQMEELVLFLPVRKRDRVFRREMVELQLRYGLHVHSPQREEMFEVSATAGEGFGLSDDILVGYSSGDKHTIRDCLDWARYPTNVFVSQMAVLIGSMFGKKPTLLVGTESLRCVIAVPMTKDMADLDDLHVLFKQEGVATEIRAQPSRAQLPSTMHEANWGHQCRQRRQTPGIHNSTDPLGQRELAAKHERIRAPIHQRSRKMLDSAMSANCSANAPKVSAPTLASSTWTPEAASAVRSDSMGREEDQPTWDREKNCTVRHQEIRRRGDINWDRSEIDIMQHKIEAARKINTNRRRRLHDEFSEDCLDVTAIPMSEVFAQWTARITLLPDAAASCARSLKTEPTEAWAGSDAR